MGVTIAGSGTISSSTGSISFNDDNITTTGTIPAAQLTGQVPSANLNNAPDLSSDIRALALQSASDRIGLENGIADPFSDETDVDTSTSSNETHNSSSTSYSGAESATVAQGLGTAIGNATDYGGLAAAFDGNLSQGWTSTASNSSNDTFIGKDWGSGNTKTIKSVQVYSSSTHNISGGSSATATFTIQGSTDNFSSSTVDLGTGDLTINAGGNATLAATDLSTAYRYHRVKITTSSGSCGVGELIFTEQIYNNMTLISNAFTADSAPSNSIIGVQVVENESITVNTDLTAEVSRDGGTTFTSCTLALKTSLAATSTKYYESASTDISSQPSGTAMKYRIKTLNSKNIEVHGVALKWS